MPSKRATPRVIQPSLFDSAVVKEQMAQNLEEIDNGFFDDLDHMQVDDGSTFFSMLDKMDDALYYMTYTVLGQKTKRPAINETAIRTAVRLWMDGPVFGNIRAYKEVDGVTTRLDLTTELEAQRVHVCSVCKKNLRGNGHELINRQWQCPQDDSGGGPYDYRTERGPSRTRRLLRRPRRG